MHNKNKHFNPIESKCNGVATKIDIKHGKQSPEYDGHKNTNLIKNRNDTNHGIEQRNTTSHTSITCPSHSCANLIEVDYDSNKLQQQCPGTHTKKALLITKINLQAELQEKHQQQDKKLSTHIPSAPIAKYTYTES